jgi:hypothetical protein
LKINLAVNPSSTTKLFSNYLEDIATMAITIPKGQMIATMPLTTIDNKAYEGDRTLVVDLAKGDYNDNPSCNTSAILIIKDNELPPAYQRVHIFDFVTATAKPGDTQYSPPNPGTPCVNLGFVASGDKPFVKTFTVASTAKTHFSPNNGQSDEVESINIAPYANGEFELIDSTTSNLHNLFGLIKQDFTQTKSPILGYGTYGTFQIKFTPPANNVSTAPFLRDVQIFTTDPLAKPIILHLNAFAVSSTQPKLEVWNGSTIIQNETTSPIDLGVSTLGNSIPRTLTVKNMGYSDLTLATVRFQPGTDDGFTVSPFVKSPLTAPTPKDTPTACASTLSYDSTTFDVTLTASKAGKFKGKLIITSNDGGVANSTFTFPVKGEVLGPLPVDQEIAVFNGNNEITNNTGGMDFGSTTVGKPVLTTLRIKNLSNLKPLTIHDINLPDGFSLLKNDYPDTIQPSSSLDVVLQLDATSANTFEGEVRIANDDADNGNADNNDGVENPFTFKVKGTVTGGDNCFENQNGVLLNKICHAAAKLLPGAFNNSGAPAATTAEIVGGTAKGGGDYLSPTTVTTADPVVMAGSLKAAPDDVGKTVDIIVAGLYYTAVAPDGYIWYMLNGKNGCLTCVEVWNFNSTDIAASLTSLTAFKTGLALPTYLPVQIYAGNLPYPGNLNVYLGYRLTSGTDAGKIVFNAMPISVTIQP